MVEGFSPGASGSLAGSRTRDHLFDSRRRSALAIGLGLTLPLAIAIAWMPVRSRLPNVDLALVLIVSVAALGALGNRTAVFVASVSASLWFEFFDTAPFERLAIARSPDLETTLILAVVALMVGELAVRTMRHRGFARKEFEKLSSIRSTAELIASGEELVGVIESVAGDLTRLLQLRTCIFESTESDPGRSRLTRDGRLLRPTGQPVLVLPSAGDNPAEGQAREPDDAELPVIVQGVAIGHFVLGFVSDEPPQRDRLLIAVTLADNVGAAFLAQAPPPVPPDKQPALRLKVLGAPPGDSAKAASPVPQGHETAGFSRAIG